MSWKKFKNTVRWLMAPLLFFYLLSRVDLLEVARLMGGFEWLWGILIILVLFFTLTLNTIRWRRLLAVHNYFLDFFSLLKFRLIGLMYSDILPSSFSGEMIRAYYLTRAEKVDNSVAVSTIIIEKISNLLILFFFLFFGLLFNVQMLLADINNFVFILVLVIFGLLVLLVVFFSNKFKRLVLKPLARFNFKLLNFLKKYYQAIHFYREHLPLLLYSVFISGIIQTFSILMNYFIAHGLGLELGFMQIFFVMSLVLLANLVPASLGNWGWREGVYVYALSLYGVDYNSALAMALFSRLVRLLMSLAGLVFAFGYKNIFKLQLKSF